MTRAIRILIAIPFVGLCYGFTFNMGAFWTNHQAVASCDPSTVPNLTLWLDGRDTSTMFQDIGGTVPVTGNGDPVGSWVNKVNGSQSFAYSVPVDDFRPTYLAAGINGKPTLQFDGNDDIYLGPNLDQFVNAGTFTVFAVVQQDDMMGRGIFGQSGVQNAYEIVTNPIGFIIHRYKTGSGSGNTTGQFFEDIPLVTYARMAPSGFMRFSQGQNDDGYHTSVSGGDIAPLNSAITVGGSASGGNKFGGKIGAILIYNRNLSDAETLEVSTCLMSQFLIP